MYMWTYIYIFKIVILQFSLSIKNLLAQLQREINNTYKKRFTNYILISYRGDKSFFCENFHGNILEIFI